MWYTLVSLIFEAIGVQIGRYQDAASAAVTVLAAQPDHKVMSDNLKQYIDNFGADPEALENMELKVRNFN